MRGAVSILAKFAAFRKRPRSAPPKSRLRRERPTLYRFSAMSATQRNPRRRLAAFALGIAFALASAFAAGSAVRAQSPFADDGDFDPLFTRAVAPYDVAVRWLPPAPQVGFVNVAVKPSLADSGEPVMDARVRIVAEGEERSGFMARIAGESDPDFEVLAVNSPASPFVYRATMKFEEAGNWTLRFVVDSPTAGSAEFAAPIVVLPPPIPPGGQGGWAFLGIVLALSAGAGYAVWAIRKAQAAQRARLTNPG